MMPKIEFEEAAKPRYTEHSDQILRDWHRKRLSAQYPCMDIDCVEYDQAQPKALIEFKYNTVDRETLSFRNANLLCFRNLANRARLPAFISLWEKSCTEFTVLPWNGFAQKILTHERLMSESEYINFLQSLRMPEK